MTNPVLLFLYKFFGFTRNEKFLFHYVLSNAYRLKLITGETSTLLAPVGSTVIGVQIETEVIFFANPKDFYVV